MSTYKVGVLVGERSVEIRELELKKPVGKQVLVNVDSCAICTMEQRVYQGIMKRYPFAGGHEMAGTVAAIGEAVKSVKPGDKVAMRMLTSCGECYYCRIGKENQCLTAFKTTIHEGLIGPGGFAQYMTVDAGSVYKMAADIDLSYAALTDPLACGVHSMGRGDIGMGNDVVIIGAGIMGAFHIQLAKLKGARVIVCEVDKGRIKIAKKMGAHVVIDSSEEDPVAKIKELTDNRGADVVFCTVALPEVAAQSVALVGKLGRVVFYSSFHPDKPIEVNPNVIHSAETIITGSVNPTPADFLAASRLLSFGIIDPSLLISERIPLDSLSKSFEKAIVPSTYRVVVQCS